MAVLSLVNTAAEKPACACARKHRHRYVRGKKKKNGHGRRRQRADAASVPRVAPTCAVYTTRAIYPHATCTLHANCASPQPLPRAYRACGQRCVRYGGRTAAWRGLRPPFPILTRQRRLCTAFFSIPATTTEVLPSFFRMVLTYSFVWDGRHFPSILRYPHHITTHIRGTQRALCQQQPRWHNSQTL